MKKICVFIALMFLSGGIFCKKERTEPVQEVVLAKKYAKYRVVVRKELELKNWAATLEKGEDVDLLSEQEVANKSGKNISISRVRLADGSQGFVESRHLADKVIVFIEDTPAFTRPTMGSKMYCKVPKGTIAFVVGEQANWVKIYAGKIADLWLTDQWVQGGYSTDQQILLTARMYESALEQLASAKEADRNAGKQKLVELSQGEGVIAALAGEKLTALESQPEEKVEKATQDEAVQK